MCACTYFTDQCNVLNDDGSLCCGKSQTGLHRGAEKVGEDKSVMAKL